MGKRKLIIADGTEEFRMALARKLEAEYEIRVCHEGEQTLEMLASFRPDVLVLDLTMPGLDGITLLQRAAESGLQPVVLATTRFLNDYVLDSVSRLGVGYLMVKPCNISATVSRLGDLTQHLRPPAVTRPDPKTEISNVLLSLGIPTKLRGYSYLREAVFLALHHSDQMVTKELYPAVGKLCDATAVQVERSIRSAIASAWKKRDPQVWNRYFPPLPDGTVSRPTNAAFIFCLAEWTAVDSGSFPEITP